MSQVSARNGRTLPVDSLVSSTMLEGRRDACTLLLRLVLDPYTHTKW